MELGITEMLDAEIWKRVHEEGWRMWKGGLDKLRKAENGLEAAMAKQMMLDAESILRIPTRLKIRAGTNDGNTRERYGVSLERKEAQIVKDTFETAVKEGK